MADALGLIIFVAYITVVIAVAAGVTWLVVRFTPSKKPGATPKT